MINRNEMIRLARVAFGHQDGLDDVDLLCLRISQLDRLAQERLLAIDSLHKKIIQLEQSIRQLQKRAPEHSGRCEPHVVHSAYET